jgi:serine/threonine protein kinase
MLCCCTTKSATTLTTATTTTAFNAQGGDLYTALRQHSSMMAWERLGRKVALDVALGLNYLHCQRPPMMHRDLKSPNVLLSEEGVAKIADVGMLRSQASSLVTAQPVMTPLWAAPEVGDHVLIFVLNSHCQTWAECCDINFLPAAAKCAHTHTQKQVVRHERASIKADIWSFGILIFEIASGEDITQFRPLSIKRQVCSNIRDS